MNDTLCQEDSPMQVKKIEFLRPMVALAVEPKSRKDEQKISASLQKLADEDPTFQVERDRQTKELVIRGLSQFHLDIMIARLQHRFEVEVTTKQPKIAYLETVTAKGEGHYRHKKQTGGRGQFGECYVRVMPLERGKGFEFENMVFGGAVPSNFMPAIEKGAREELERGILANSPVVDVRMEVYDGSYHDVDSDEQSFKIAGARAFRDGFMNAKPVLLEPIVNIEITIPSKFMGDIAGDLSGRRGRIVGMDSTGNLQVIKAQVPMKEIGKYSTELRSMTGGEASYTVEFSHYDIVPHKLAEEIIAQAKKTTEEE
jgi:elongation factor G